MTKDFNYCLSPGVKARREKFGLLFFNSKDTNLTFVKSGDLLDIEVSGNSFMLTVNLNNIIEEAKLIRCIKVLLNKRLIIETRNGI